MVTDAVRETSNTSDDKPFTEPGVKPNPFIGSLTWEYEQRQPITRSGHVKADLLSTCDYDTLVKHLTYAPSIRVSEIPQDVLLGVIDRIGSRVKQEKERHAGPLPLPSFTRATHGKDAISNLLRNYYRNPDTPFPREAIQRIRTFYQNPYPEVQALERFNIAKLIALDERNDEQVGLRGEVAREIAAEVRTMQTREEADEAEIRTTAYTIACGREATREIMDNYITETEELPLSMFQIFGNALGFETMRAFINDHVRKHPENRERLESLEKEAGLQVGDIVLFGPGELYKRIAEDEGLRKTFEDYGPYKELQETDIDILSEQLRGKKRVVDVGCGQGRHLIPLLKQGVPVEGVDLSEEELNALKTKEPDATVHVGSMKQLPYEDGEVDAVYSLGRSLTHIESIRDAVDVFTEFRRVLETGGTVIFDLPDLGSEEMRFYTEQRKQFLWDKLRVKNVEHGFIHDSPDGKHFIDRFILDWGEVERLAHLADFSATQIGQVPYTGASGKRARNVYWKLTARPRHAQKVPVEDLQPLRFISSTEDKGYDIDRY